MMLGFIQKHVCTFPAVFLVGALAVMAISVIVPSPTADPQLGLQGPSWQHFLGTSPYGHDLLLLTVVSSIRAAAQAIWATGLTLAIALVVGIVSAYRRDGIFDALQAVLARLLDSISLFIIAACLCTVARRVTPWTLVTLLPLFAWPNLSHTIRAETLAIMKLPYVEAARALGCSRLRIARVYLLPEMSARLLPTVISIIGVFVAIVGSLQFLGVGIAEEMALGYMLFDASQQFLRTAPWYFAASFGGFVVLLATLAGLAAYFHSREVNP